MWLILFQDRGGAFLYSFLVGALIGLIYDFFRISRVLFGKGRVKIFFEDLVFCLMSAVLLCVFIFNATMGMIRLFAFCGIAVGFFFHYFTFGKLTVGFAIVLRKIFGPYIIRFKNWVQSFTTALSDRISSASFRRRLRSSAAKGFGVHF